jgi:hypothetical protein
MKELIEKYVKVGVHQNNQVLLIGLYQESVLLVKMV